MLIENTLFGIEIRVILNQIKEAEIIMLQEDIRKSRQG